MKRLNYIIFTLILFLVLGSVSAKEITINLFYSSTCPHCAAEKEFLNEYIKENRNVKVELYEVTENEDNAKLLDDVKETLGSINNYVPYTVIGEIGLTGYSDSIKNQIIHFVDKYQTEEYYDLVSKVKKEGKAIDLTKEDDTKEVDNKKEAEETIKLPIIGEVAKSKISLPVAAIIIGFIDGFNPCAMWILLFLINMLIGIKDKKKSWIIGFTFLFVSGLVYFLSMIGINLAVSAITINWIKILIALFILIFGIINLRKYFKMRKEEAGCSVVDSKKRKKINSSIHKILESKSFLFALLGTSLLAASVNLVELACSLGFPLVFTEILSINKVTGLLRIIYLLIYIFFYMIDDIVVFVLSMKTLEATGVTNKYNKLCTLISSIIMIIMGILLIFKPEWLMLNF